MNSKNDLTVGSIPKKIIGLTLPILGTSFINMAYSFIDMICIGQIGAGAVAAVGTAGYFMWFAQASSSIARIGAQVTVAQSIGKKEYKEAKEYAEASIWLNSFLAIAFTLALVFLSGPLVGFFNLGDPQIIKDTRIYVVVVGLSMMFVYINPVLSAMFNSSGNSKLPFVFNTCGLIFNIVFDIVLIFGLGPIPAMGVFGAAVATALAQVLVFLLFLVYILKSKDQLLKINMFKAPNWAKIYQVAKIGFPSALQATLYCVFSIVIARTIASFGAVSIAVQKVGSQIESISWMTADGLAIAITAFVGQNYGSRKFDRIEKGVKVIFGLAMIIGVFATALLVFGGQPLFRIFLDDPLAIPGGVSYLKILGYSQIFLCFEILAIGLFNGFGETKTPAILSIIFTSIRIPMALILSQTAGVDGVWWAISISTIIKGILIPLAYIRFKRNSSYSMMN